MAKRRSKKAAEETLIDVVEVKEHAQDYFEKNKYLILGVLGAIVLIAGGYLFYTLGLKAPKEKMAMEAIYKAEQQFERDSFALALENPGGGFEGFLDIIDNYNGTKAANLAKLYAGISYLNLGRYDDAIAYLEAHSGEGNVSPIMKNGNLGDAYSEMGDYDKAISFYKKAVSAGDNELLTPYYMNKLALLQRRQGDDAGALSNFQKIKEKYPDSNEGINVDRYIALLNNS